MLWKQARLFLLNSVLAALVLNIDYVILSQTVPAAAIAAYAIMARIYGLAFSFYNSMLQAYWPVSAEAIHRGDPAAVRGIVVRVVAFGLSIVLATSALLWWALPLVVRALTPAGDLHVPLSLVPAFAVYWSLRVWSDTWATLNLSAGESWFQCKLTGVQAVLNVALGVTGAVIAEVPGLIIGASLSFVLTGVWLQPLHLLRVLRRAEPIKADAAPQANASI